MFIAGRLTVLSHGGPNLPAWLLCWLLIPGGYGALVGMYPFGTFIYVQLAVVIFSTAIAIVYSAKQKRPLLHRLALIMFCYITAVFSTNVIGLGLILYYR